MQRSRKSCQDNPNARSIQQVKTINFSENFELKIASIKDVNGKLLADDANITDTMERTLRTSTKCQHT